MTEEEFEALEEFIEAKITESSSNYIEDTGRVIELRADFITRFIDNSGGYADHRNQDV